MNEKYWNSNITFPSIRLTICGYLAPSCGIKQSDALTSQFENDVTMSEIPSKVSDCLCETEWFYTHKCAAICQCILRLQEHEQFHDFRMIYFQTSFLIIFKKYIYITNIFSEVSCSSVCISHQIQTPVLRDTQRHTGLETS